MFSWYKVAGGNSSIYLSTVVDQPLFHCAKFPVDGAFIAISKHFGNLFLV